MRRRFFYGECTQAMLKHSYASNFTCPLASRGVLLLHSTYEADCQKLPGLIDSIGKSGPSSIGGLREAVGGRTSRNHSWLYRRKTFRMIIVRNNDYVTHEVSAKLGILPIDSPLHRLWRSFPPDGGQDIIEGTIFLDIVPFVPSPASPELPFRGEPFRVPFLSIPKKTVRHIFHFLHGSDEANCQKRPGLIDAIGKSGPSSIGGLREAVGGRTSRKDLRLYRRKTVRMITSRNYDYVTREASVKPGILAIDSPLHRLWRSFPRRGAGQFRRGTFFLICAVPPHWLRRSSPFEGAFSRTVFVNSEENRTAYISFSPWFR